MTFYSNVQPRRRRLLPVVRDWSCLVCQAINRSYLTRCRMCGFKRTTEAT